jgi:hypothetical protein
MKAYDGGEGGDTGLIAWLIYPLGKEHGWMDIIANLDSAEKRKFFISFAN